MMTSDVVRSIQHAERNLLPDTDRVRRVHRDSHDWYTGTHSRRARARQPRRNYRQGRRPLADTATSDQPAQGD